MGFKFYPPDLGVTICRSTEEEFFTQEFLASYMFDLQHSFVSFEGKSAAYNNFNRGSKKVQFFKSFLLHNPTVGRPTPGFCQSIPRTDDKEVEEEEDEEDEEDEEEEEEEKEEDGAERGEELEKEEDGAVGGRSSMHKLFRQKLTTAFFNHQVYQEMNERGQIASEIFGPKIDHDSGLKVGFKKSLEQYMEKVLFQPGN